MKAKLRIKIMQEQDKAKNIRLVSNDITKSESYKLRHARDIINKKIEFYKKISETIEGDKNESSNRNK